ncbi:MAG: AraC family transcriptional regulator [Clostridiales bacterium]|nr:AraC family transcriptional regulator [Clostridiales bacterium]
MKVLPEFSKATYSPANLILLNIGYAEENGHWNYNNVCSPFTRIYYVTDGSAVLTIGEKRYSLSPGHMYAVPAMSTHSNANVGVFNHYYIHMLEELPWGENLLDSFNVPVEIEASDDDLKLFHTLWCRNQHMRLPDANPSVYDNNRTLMEAVKTSRERPLDERLFSAGILLQILSKFIKYATPKYEVSDKRLRMALEFLNSHIYEDFSIDEVARVACLSTDHFLKLFRNRLGLTPRQYVINARMKRAKVRLATDAMPINRVAAKVGYDDPSYFSRIFRKNESLTPQQYRDSFNS